MVGHCTFVLNIFDRTVVKFFKRAIQSDHDILRRGWFRLVQASLAVSEDALKHVGAIQASLFQQQLGAAQFRLKVALGIHL